MDNPEKLAMFSTQDPDTQNWPSRYN